jgi:uncharacterized protein YndB with AHSA1/START domain
MMALESIRVSAVIPATPDRIYEAWLDAEQHSAFTGGRATIEPGVGGRHTAWDGYIEGETLELDPGRRIVQSWRSLDFPAGASPSRLEVLLAETAGGTELTLVHTEIPEGQGEQYETGWVDHYFKPMAQYFSRRTQSEPRLPDLTAESWDVPTMVEHRPIVPLPETARPKRAPSKRPAKAKKKAPAKKAKKASAAKKKAAPKKKAAKSVAKRKAAPKKKGSKRKSGASKK